MFIRTLPFAKRENQLYGSFARAGFYFINILRLSLLLIYFYVIYTLMKLISEYFRYFDIIVTLFYFYTKLLKFMYILLNIYRFGNKILLYFIIMLGGVRYEDEAIW